MDRVKAIAQAVLYEGYLLWPYRRSAPKNRQRWTFGGVFPPAWTREHPDDPSILRAQCLIEGDEETRVAVTLRFLQVVDRRVAEGGRWVDELVVDGERHLAWEEATERELAVPETRLAALADGVRRPLSIAPDIRAEPIAAQAAVVREWEGLTGMVDVSAQRVSDGVWRLTVEVTNTAAGAFETRPDAMRRALVSTHLVLRARGGAFVSLTDPPDALADLARTCANTGTWPVLAGEEGERDTLLCAPIILPDHPRVAPESPGDLFDSTEIDRLLVLNTLSLTEDEQREVRASDPRARELLDRCAGLSREELMRLHLGAMREVRPMGES